MTDPRTNGFNYGAPVAKPDHLTFQYYEDLADTLREASCIGDRRSWDLDMAIRDVRHSCSEAEQEAALHRLYRSF